MIVPSLAITSCWIFTLFPCIIITIINDGVNLIMRHKSLTSLLRGKIPRNGISRSKGWALLKYYTGLSCFPERSNQLIPISDMCEHSVR